MRDDNIGDTIGIRMPSIHAGIPGFVDQTLTGSLALYPALLLSYHFPLSVQVGEKGIIFYINRISCPLAGMMNAEREN